MQNLSHRLFAALYKSFVSMLVKYLARNQSMIDTILHHFINNLMSSRCLCRFFFRTQEVVLHPSNHQG